MHNFNNVARDTFHSPDNSRHTNSMWRCNRINWILAFLAFLALTLCQRCPLTGCGSGLQIESEPFQLRAQDNFPHIPTFCRWWGEAVSCHQMQSRQSRHDSILGSQQCSQRKTKPKPTRGLDTVGKVGMWIWNQVSFKINSNASQNL